MLFRSDPYLMTGYNHKTLELSHDAKEPVTFTVEVDFLADGSWSEYARLTVEPGKRTHVAPPGKKTFWIRQADTASGAIPLSIADLDGKDVRVVVMRADGKPGMAFDATAVIHVPVVRPIGFAVLAGAIIVIALGAGLIVLLATRKRKTPPAAPPAAPDAPAVDTA